MVEPYFTMLWGEDIPAWSRPTVRDVAARSQSLPAASPVTPMAGWKSPLGRRQDDADVDDGQHCITGWTSAGMSARSATTWWFSRRPLPSSRRGGRRRTIKSSRNDTGQPRWQSDRMPMALRFEIFPADLDSTVGFHTLLLGLRLRTSQAGGACRLCGHGTRQRRVGGAARPEGGDRSHRRPPTGVELVLEVNEVKGERDRVPESG
jgi:hypothetical protein